MMSLNVAAQAPVLLIVLPLAGAVIALVGKAMPRASSVRWIAVIPLGLSALVLIPGYVEVQQAGSIVYRVGGFAPPLAIPLVMDGLAWLSTALVVVMSLIVAITSLARSEFDALYFFFLLTAVAGMQMVALTADMFTLFVSFEVVAIAVYVLIAWERSPEGLLAGLKYLFLSSVGILFFLFGVFLVYRDLGHLSFEGIAGALAEMRESGVLVGPAAGGGGAGSGLLPPAGPSRSLPPAIAALCVGIGVRTAFIPFHTWLPEAHAWAPHPISALLSGVLIKISFLAMTRIIRLFGIAYLNPVLMWIGAITALVAVGWALVQHDAKRLLAFHSISQMGYILAAWGAAGTAAAAAGAAPAFTAAYAHAVGHALFKSLLFIAVGIAIERARTRDVYRMRGAAGGAPLLRIGVIVGALAISGVPPLNGFVGKELIGDVLYGSPAYTLLLITSVGTTASFVKLSRIAWPGSDRASAAAAAAAPMGHAGERIGRAGSAIRAPAEAEPSPPMRPMRLSPLDGTAVATLIGLVCATGIAGGPAVRTLHRITAPNVAPPSTDFFSLSSVAEAMVPVAFGVAVAFVVMSPRGRAAAHRLQRVSPQLRTVLVFFVLGLMLFALAPLLVFGT